MTHIEHWRDGELVKRYEVTPEMLRRTDGLTRVILPPGYIELVTGDELRFDTEGLIRCLTNPHS